MAGIFDSELEDVGGGKTVNDVLLDFGNEIQDDLRNNLEILDHTDICRAPAQQNYK